MGDPTELRGQDRDLPLAAPNRERQNRAFRSMAAIILIVCSIMPVIMIRTRFGPALMFLMVATGIGLLVYNSVIKPTYHKPESPDCGYVPGGAEYCAKTGSHVEDTGKKRRSFELHIILWTLILAIYFVYSFISGAWYISWVIFLVVPR